MKSSLKEKFGFWLEKVEWTHRYILKYDGEAPGKKRRYINKINGHVLTKPPVFEPDECLWGGPETAACYHPGACGCRVPGMFT